MSVNIRRLTVFVTIAQTGSVTEAARKLNMTPPAATKSLRELETTLAVELFQRTSSGMLLTPAGETYLIHAERALTEIERGREHVAMLMGGHGGRVSVGVTADAAMQVFPMALGRLIERRKQMAVNLAGGTFEMLTRDVRKGTLDFMFGVAPFEGVGAGLTMDPIYQDELRIVVRAGHPLANRKNLTLANLTEWRWIQSASQGPLANLLRGAFRHAGVTFPESSVVMEPLSAMMGLLQHSDLLAAVTGARMREHAEYGKIVPLDVALPNTRHVVSVVRRDEQHVTIWTRELITQLRQTARELGMAVTPQP